MISKCGKPVGWPYPDNCNMAAGHDGQCLVLGPGGRIVRADEPASRVEPCGLCGALSPSSAKFCCSCGASFNGAPRSVDVAALRELLERAYAESLKEDIDDYTAACVLTDGIVAALALLAPERRGSRRGCPMGGA